MAVATATRRSVGLTRSRTARTRLFGYALLLPALLYILALVALPFLLAMWYSVSDVSVTSLRGNFVGLKNFADLLHDPAFKEALRNTFVYTFFSIVLTSILGTFLAFILLDTFRGKRAVRFLLLLPFTIPIALTILSWRWMFDSQYSVLNWLGKNTHFYALLNWLAAHTPLHFLSIPPYGIQWLGRPWVAMGAVIAINVWRNFPFSAIVLLAGLTSIPSEVIDAARIDGARAWTRYSKVIVPMIAPILFIGLLFNLIFTFSDLTIVYLLTQGGPANATLVLGVRAFQVGIGSGDLSHGAATTLFLFPVLLIFTVLFLRSLRRREM